MYLPNICVDNFFNDPDKIYEYAMSQEFYSASNDSVEARERGLPLGYWPGKRTKPFHIIDSDFTEALSNKIMALFFGSIREVTLESYFQLIYPHEHKEIKNGWIHTDSGSTKYAGVVYLNKNMSLDSGTSLYRQKKMGPDLSVNFVKARNLHYSPNFADKDILYIKEQLENNNSYYEETVRFNAIYNRLVGYDSSYHHGVRDYHGNNNEPRLTLVFFIHGIKSDWFPIPESKRIHI
jgi:hypothetical protein